MEVNTRSPLVVLLKGHPCCGKSTFAKNLARVLRCALIDKDDAKGVLCHALSDSVNEGTLNDLSYSIMFKSVQTQLEAGLNCIVDSPLSRRAHFEKLLHICHKVSGRVALIECVARDEVIWKARVDERAQRLAGTRDQHKAFTWTELQDLIAAYQDCWKWSENIPDHELAYRSIVDTTSTNATLHEVIGRELQKAAEQ